MPSAAPRCNYSPLPDPIMNFREILWSVANKAGLVPQESDGLQIAEAVQITDAINTAMRYAWNRYDWPPVCPVSAVQLTAHSRGTRHLPIADAPETVFAFYEADPLVGNARELRNYQDPEGYHLPPDSPDTVWCRYRPAAPTYNAIDWRDDVTYRAGDVVYYEPKRNCYRVNDSVPSTVGTSPLDTGVWEEVPVPAFLAEAVKAAAFALFTSTEGQHGTAALLSSAADNLLDEEVDRFEFQQHRSHKPWR
jgi:hypothetical protein